MSALCCVMGSAMAFCPETVANEDLVGDSGIPCCKNVRKKTHPCWAAGWPEIRTPRYGSCVVLWKGVPSIHQFIQPMAGWKRSIQKGECETRQAQQPTNDGFSVGKRFRRLVGGFFPKEAVGLEQIFIRLAVVLGFWGVLHLFCWGLEVSKITSNHLGFWEILHHLGWIKPEWKLGCFWYELVSQDFCSSTVSWENFKLKNRFFFWGGGTRLLKNSCSCQAITSRRKEMKEAMQDVVREKLESVRAELEGPCRHSNGETAGLDSSICDTHQESTGLDRAFWLRWRTRSKCWYGYDLGKKKQGRRIPRDFRWIFWSGRGDMNPVGFFGMHFEVSQILTGSCAWLVVWKLENNPHVCRCWKPSRRSRGRSRRLNKPRWIDSSWGRDPVKWRLAVGPERCIIYLAEKRLKIGYVSRNIYRSTYTHTHRHTSCVYICIYSAPPKIP